MDLNLDLARVVGFDVGGGEGGHTCGQWKESGVDTYHTHSVCCSRWQVKRRHFRSFRLTDGFGSVESRGNNGYI